jgi:hypothetical protein
MMISDTDLDETTAVAPIVADGRDRLLRLEFHVVHHLRGRLRLRSARLTGNARVSEKARLHFAQLTGITSATANVCTGSLLLEYNSTLISPGTVIDVLRAHGYNILATTEEATEPGPTWAEQLTISIKDRVIDAVAERLALAMIGALAKRIAAGSWC